MCVCHFTSCLYALAVQKAGDDSCFDALAWGCFDMINVQVTNYYHYRS